MLQTIINRVIYKTELKHVLMLMLVLLSPALFTGLMGDDLFHYALLNGAANFPQPEDISLFHLFSFINDDPIRRAQLQDMSIMSWWISPTFSWNFWRPLAELTHYVDYVWLTEHVWLMHLHSIFYFIIIVLLVYQLCLLIFDNQRLALLITALYALSATHGMTVAWLCNRNALLALLFSLSSLIFFIKSQQHRKNTYYFLSLAFLIPALLSGEIALSLGAFLFAYIVCLSPKPILRSFILLLPHLLIVIIWYTIYTRSGFGAHGNTLFYINPAEHPITYLTLLLERIPSITLSLLLAIPADILGNIPVIKWPLIALFIFSVFFLSRFFQPSRYKKQAIFFAVAGLIAIFPIACSPPQSRNLVFVSFSSAAIIAIVLFELYKQHDSRKSKFTFSSLIALHLVLSPLLLLLSAYIPQLFSTAGEKRAATFNVEAQDKVIVFDADMMEITYLAANLFKQGKPIPQRIWNLTGVDSEYTIEKIDEYRLRLTATKHFLSQADLLVRNIEQEPFQAKDKIKMNGLKIKILDTNEAGLPTVIEAIFDEKIEQHIILKWTTEGYKTLTL
ncbi:MAG: hypothetical protein HRU20_05315 [Pseudomonadales bacterium]|nr:hypothetical protein [Pseudomonadales bacterium]